MNILNIYKVDAFTDHVFSGNSAAICILNHWISSNLMQQIASENNLAETAFLVYEKGQYLIRWFTPTVEVDLCGHATLAAAHILYELGKETGSQINFFSPRSGLLIVDKIGELLTLNFPADILIEEEITEQLIAGIDIKPVKVLRGKTDFIFVYQSEAEVKNLQVDFKVIAKLDCRGIIVTAKGNQVDFVSRFFGPQSGIDEDPVTGSAHTSLTPYWADVLGKKQMNAKQLSARGGFLKVEDCGDIIKISGTAITFLKGQIFF